jgi:hypothetical protein
VTEQELFALMPPTWVKVIQAALEVRKHQHAKFERCGVDQVEDEQDNEICGADEHLAYEVAAIEDYKPKSSPQVSVGTSKPGGKLEPTHQLVVNIRLTNPDQLILWSVRAADIRHEKSCIDLTLGPIPKEGPGEAALNEFEVEVLTFLGAPGAPLLSREVALQELRAIRAAVAPGEAQTLAMAVVETADALQLLPVGEHAHGH